MQPVLVDANVMIECHAKECWAALSGGFPVETVTQCVIETQTGFQKRRPEHRIDEQILRRSLAHVHDVTDDQRATVLVGRGGGGLDAGELDLWAHAFTRQDAWILCGPDKASMRFGYENGAKDRLVSLGGLLGGIHYKPRQALRPHFEQRWLEDFRTQLVLGTLGRN